MPALRRYDAHRRDLQARSATQNAGATKKGYRMIGKTQLLQRMPRNNCRFRHSISMRSAPMSPWNWRQKVRTRQGPDQYSVDTGILEYRQAPSSPSWSKRYQSRNRAFPIDILNRLPRLPPSKVCQRGPTQPSRQLHHGSHRKSFREADICCGLDMRRLDPICGHPIKPYLDFCRLQVSGTFLIYTSSNQTL